jgi:hypothetical protein
MQLADKGYFGPIVVNDELREEFLRRLGISGFTSQSNVDYERAEKENTAISMGHVEDIFLVDPQQMGEDGTPMVLNDDTLFKYDDHLIHFNSHRRKIMSDEFKSWPVKAKTILMGHAEIHQALIQPMQIKEDLSKFDDLVKSRHSRVGGNPEATKPIEKTGFPFSRE